MSLKVQGSKLRTWTLNFELELNDLIPVLLSFVPRGVVRHPGGAG
jgi:hypothetical protein